MSLSHAEAPENTALRFIESPPWQTGVNKDVLTSQLISVSKETNRKPDFDYFEVVDSLLLDPRTQKPILPEIKRNTPLQEVEYQVAVQLQDWAAKNESGIAIWISPRCQIYPCEKISIHKIAYTLYGKKVIRNSYVLFDALLNNPEDLRRFIFTEPDRGGSIPEILNWIQKVSRRSVDTDTTSHGQTERLASYFAGRIRAGEPPEAIVYEMRQTGFLGPHSVSCAGSGQSFSNILGGRSELFIFSGSEDQYGSLEFRCPSCGGLNTRPSGQLISNCQHCGADARC